MGSSPPVLRWLPGVMWHQVSLPLGKSRVVNTLCFPQIYAAWNGRSELRRQEIVTAALIWGEAKPKGLLEYSGAVLDLVPFSPAAVTMYFGLWFPPTFDLYVYLFYCPTRDRMTESWEVKGRGRRKGCRFQRCQPQFRVQLSVRPCFRACALCPLSQARVRAGELGSLGSPQNKSKHLSLQSLPRPLQWSWLLFVCLNFKCYCIVNR